MLRSCPVLARISIVVLVTADTVNNLLALSLLFPNYHLLFVVFNIVGSGTSADYLRLVVVLTAHGGRLKLAVCLLIKTAPQTLTFIHRQHTAAAGGVCAGGACSASASTLGYPVPRS